MPSDAPWDEIDQLYRDQWLMREAFKVGAGLGGRLKTPLVRWHNEAIEIQRLIDYMARRESLQREVWRRDHLTPDEKSAEAEDNAHFWDAWIRRER